MKKYLFAIYTFVIAVLITSNSFAQTHASADFELIYGPGSPSSGEIIVRYEQNDAIAQYFANDPLDVVASRIVNAVNSNATIQVTASFGSHNHHIILTEKRTGSQYNGRSIELPTTPDFHIIPDQHQLILSGGS